MFKLIFHKILTISVLCLFSSILTAQTKNIENQKFVTNQIEIKGLVDNPLTIPVEKFTERKVYERGEYKITNHEGQVKRTVANFKGILLKDVLLEAKIQLKNPKERGKFYIIVTASDGYQVIFAYTELMFNTTGETTFLAFEVEGKPLTEEGRIALYTTGDTATGPRHVRWVKTIEVKKI